MRWTAKTLIQESLKRIDMNPNDSDFNIKKDSAANMLSQNIQESGKNELHNLHEISSSNFSFDGTN